MFDFFTPTHPFGGQTLRLVAQAQQGGGDVFDIARTCNENGWPWRGSSKPKRRKLWQRGTSEAPWNISSMPINIIACPMFS